MADTTTTHPHFVRAIFEGEDFERVRRFTTHTAESWAYFRTLRDDPTVKVGYPGSGPCEVDISGEPVLEEIAG